MTHIKRPSKNHTRFLHHNAFLPNRFARILGGGFATTSFWPPGHGAVVDAKSAGFSEAYFFRVAYENHGFLWCSLFLGRQLKNPGYFLGRGLI